MTSMLGANPEQMRHLSTSFRHEAGQVLDVMRRVQGTLDSTTWTGPAADRFRSEWDTSFRVALQRLHDALQGNAQVVDSRLQAITQATH